MDAKLGRVWKDWSRLDKVELRPFQVHAALFTYKTKLRSEIASAYEQQQKALKNNFGWINFWEFQFK